MDAVVVGGGLLLWCGKGGGELPQEVEEGVTHAPVSFEYGWGDNVRVVWVAFVAFG